MVMPIVAISVRLLALVIIVAIAIRLVPAVIMRLVVIIVVRRGAVPLFGLLCLRGVLVAERHTGEHAHEDQGTKNTSHHGYQDSPFFTPYPVPHAVLQAGGLQALCV